MRDLKELVGEHIEGRDINDIAMDLKDAFDDNCQ
jgi:hypothetical protein